MDVCGRNVARCHLCNAGGDSLKACSRCKVVRYCSVACQQADWREHKRACVVKSSPVVEASKVGRCRAGESGTPLWGGSALEHETHGDRIQRLLTLPCVNDQGVRCFSSRVKKAQEFFRLGLASLLRKSWEDTATAWTEAILLEDKAMPKELAGSLLGEGPESCMFGGAIAQLREHIGVNSARLQLALLEAHWFEMQMLLVRELCARANDAQSGEEHQRQWMRLLTDLDDHARKTVEANSTDPEADRRILSRLTLLQAQYGANPPIARPPKECERLAERAVELWTDDVLARSWRGRTEDFLLLLDRGGLLECDASDYGKLCYMFAWKLRGDRARAQEYFDRGQEWERQSGQGALRRVSQEACDARDRLRREFGCG